MAKDANAQLTIVCKAIDWVEQVLKTRGLTLPEHLILQADASPLLLLVVVFLNSQLLLSLLFVCVCPLSRVIPENGCVSIVKGHSRNTCCRGVIGV